MSSVPQLWNCRGQILLLAHICSYNIQPGPASLIEADSSVEVALLIKHSWPPDSGKFMGCGDSQAGKQENLCLFSGSSSLLFPLSSLEWGLVLSSEGNKWPPAAASADPWNPQNPLKWIIIKEINFPKCSLKTFGSAIKPRRDSENESLGSSRRRLRWARRDDNGNY